MTGAGDEGPARKTAIGVMAEAPLPGRCKTQLLAAHGPAWVAGLYAAMLRDTLDGLQSVTADHFVVFMAPVATMPGEEADAATLAALGREVLGRHVHAPWEIVLQEGEGTSDRIEHAFRTLFDRGANHVLLSGSDCPTFPIEPLEQALARPEIHSEALVGPCADGRYHMIALARVEPRLLHDIPWSTPAVLPTTRVRCKELGLVLHELPAWYAVDAPSDVLALFDELRTHPERAPRTAQFLVTNA